MEKGLGAIKEDASPAAAYAVTYVPLPASIPPKLLLSWRDWRNSSAKYIARSPTLSRFLHIHQHRLRSLAPCGRFTRGYIHGFSSPPGGICLVMLASNPCFPINHPYRYSIASGPSPWIGSCAALDHASAARRCHEVRAVPGIFAALASLSSFASRYAPAARPRSEKQVFTSVLTQSTSSGKRYT